MDFDKLKVYGDTFISDGLVFLVCGDFGPAKYLYGLISCKKNLTLPDDKHFFLHTRTVHSSDRKLDNFNSSSSLSSPPYPPLPNHLHTPTLFNLTSFIDKDIAVANVSNTCYVCFQLTIDIYQTFHLYIHRIYCTYSYIRRNLLFFANDDVFKVQCAIISTINSSALFFFLKSKICTLPSHCLKPNVMILIPPFVLFPGGFS